MENRKLIGWRVRWEYFKAARNEWMSDYSETVSLPKARAFAADFKDYGARNVRIVRVYKKMRARATDVEASNLNGDVGLKSLVEACAAWEYPVAKRLREERDFYRAKYLENEKIRREAANTVALADKMCWMMDEGGGGTTQERVKQVVRGLRETLKECD